MAFSGKSLKVFLSECIYNQSKTERFYWLHIYIYNAETKGLFEVQTYNTLLLPIYTHENELNIEFF